MLKINYQTRKWNTIKSKKRETTSVFSFVKATNLFDFLVSEENSQLLLF